MAFTMIRAPSPRHFPILLQDIAFLADRVYDFISDADPPDGGCIEPEDFFFETERAVSSFASSMEHQKLPPVYFLLSAVIGFARHSSRFKRLSGARNLSRLWFA